MPPRKTAKTTKRVIAPVADVLAVTKEYTIKRGEWAGLTDKQRLFVEQYFICGLNGTEAALVVYDTTDREVAAAIGGENLRKPSIRAHVDARLDQFHLSANEVLARLAFHARGSMEHFIDPASGTIDLKKAEQAKQLGLIKRFKTKFTTTTKQTAPLSMADDDEKRQRVTTEESEVMEIEVELHDAQSALNLLGKHLNLFTDKSINLNLTPDDLKKMSVEELEQLAAGKPVTRIGGA